MRVLILGSYAPSLVNFRGQLIAAMHKFGHEVHAGAPEISGEVEADLRRLGAIIHDTPMDRHGLGLVGNIKYIIYLIKLMTAIKPDLILTYTIKPNIWGAFAAKVCRIPSASMITGLGYTFTSTDNNSFKSSIVRFISRKLYRLATNWNWRVIFQNPDDRNDFVEFGCLKTKSKSRLVNGSGVDLARFMPCDLPPSPNFLMISRILGAKGVREYAQAAQIVKSKYPEARFRLVGFLDGGPDAIDPKELKKWVAAGLEYLGHSKDVRPHLEDCRVYVLPSYREGTPRSVLEAMASGRPILTTDAPGCRETVEEGINGFLVPVKGIHELAERMEWMITNVAETAVMGENSLRMAREKYDVESVNKKLLMHLGLRE